MTVIHKTANDWRVAPNFVEYETTRETFDWSHMSRDGSRHANEHGNPVRRTTVVCHIRCADLGDDSGSVVDGA